MHVDVVDLAQRLVAIPSESTRSNVPVIDALEEVLVPAGFRVTRYPQREFDEGTGPKQNLVAERGNGARRLVFSGHVDTVPVGDESAWRYDPWAGDGIVDGRLYGRGSVDMKGQVAAIAAACMAAPTELLDDLTLTLAITSDEETGHQGIKSLTADHIFENAVGAIVGEPTGFRVIHAHKGAQTLRIDVHGVNCHSSQPLLGVNAVDNAIRLLRALEKNTDQWRAFRHPAFGDEPPTYSTVQIHGGVAHNMVPSHCSVHINVRGVIWENLGDFRAILAATFDELTREDSDAGIAPERCFRAESTVLIIAPPMLTPVDAPWHETMLSITGQQNPEFARYGTDGGVLSQVGMPCVVWGPGGIERAHTIDEFIYVDELRDAVGQYGRAIGEVARRTLPTTTTTRWIGPIKPV